MKELFHLNAVGFPNVNWLDSIPNNYSGLIIPKANLVASVQEGFGDLLFQAVMRPLFDAWFSDYKPYLGFTGVASLDYRSIELTLLIKKGIYYKQSLFRERNHKQYELNLTHAMAMDNKVRFEKDVLYATFDIHYKLVVFEILMSLIPELVYPFLNEYHAGRDVALFNEETYPDKQILDNVVYIIHSLKTNVYAPNVLDLRSVLLLAHVFLWKAEITQRRGLSARQAEISLHINKVIADLMLADAPFKGIGYYAKAAEMNTTYFKRNFKDITGVAAKKFLQRHILERTFNAISNTDEPIKLIAKKAGYLSLSSFYKAFYNEFNMTPGDLRNNIF